MGRKRRGEHGRIESGRLTLDDSTRDVIRTYTFLKMRQAQAEVRRARAAHERMRTDQSAGQLRYAEHVCAWLEGLYAQGQHGVPPLEWEEAWRHVTVTERHVGVTRPDQPCLPGMEG